MRYDVIAVVASRRGLSQLRELVSQLPPEFGVPIVCLAEADSRLVADLSSITRLKVKWAEAGEVVKPGHVYVSAPGTSIVMRDGCVLSVTPTDPAATSMRPVDSFLASASHACGNRALALVLAAFPEDGAEGAYSVKWRGGSVLVLDRATAEYYGMADAIVKAGSYDRILTAGEVANALRASFTGLDLLQNAEIQFHLGALLDSALRVAGTHMGNVHLNEPGAMRLHLVAHRGVGRPFLDRFSIVEPTDGWPCVRAAESRTRVVIENVFDDEHSAAFRDVARETGFSAIQATPIVSGDDVRGVLSTLYPHPHTVTRHEAQDLDAIVGEARELLGQFR